VREYNLILEFKSREMFGRNSRKDRSSKGDVARLRSQESEETGKSSGVESRYFEISTSRSGPARSLLAQAEQGGPRHRLLYGED